MVVICMKFGTLFNIKIPGEMARGFPNFNWFHWKKSVYVYIFMLKMLKLQTGITISVFGKSEIPFGISLASVSPSQVIFIFEDATTSNWIQLNLNLLWYSIYGWCPFWILIIDYVINSRAINCVKVLN